MNTSDLGYLYLKSHLMGFATQINVVALYVLYSTYINDFFICFYKGVSMPSLFILQQGNASSLMTVFVCKVQSKIGVHGRLSLEWFPGGYATCKWVYVQQMFLIDFSYSLMTATGCVYVLIQFIFSVTALSFITSSNLLELSLI